MRAWLSTLFFFHCRITTLHCRPTAAFAYVLRAVRSVPQDHLLPYLCDPRLPPDTLCFVLEEDFRIYRSEAELREEVWRPGTAASSGAAPPPGAPGWGAGGGGAYYTQEEPEAPAPRWEWRSWQEGGSGSDWWAEWWSWGHSGWTAGGEQRWGAPEEAEAVRAPRRHFLATRPHEVLSTSEGLEDLVRYATAAWRSNSGDLIWYTFCPSTKGRKPARARLLVHRADAACGPLHRGTHARRESEAP